MNEMYRGMTAVFGVIAIVIGVLFVALGAGRLYLLRRRQ